MRIVALPADVTPAVISEIDARRVEFSVGVQPMTPTTETALLRLGRESGSWILAVRHRSLMAGFAVELPVVRKLCVSTVVHATTSTLQEMTATVENRFKRWSLSIAGIL